MGLKTNLNEGEECSPEVELVADRTVPSSLAELQP